MSGLLAGTMEDLCKSCKNRDFLDPYMIAMFQCRDHDKRVSLSTISSDENCGRVKMDRGTLMLTWRNQVF
jgi:hypothetical protein